MTDNPLSSLTTNELLKLRGLIMECHQEAVGRPEMTKTSSEMRRFVEAIHAGIPHSVSHTWPDQDVIKLYSGKGAAIIAYLYIELRNRAS